MTRDAKRLAAALAAVNRYLEQEETPRTLVAVPSTSPSPWALAGRLEQMSVRASMLARGRR
jgi:hypothetical protein